MKTPFGFPVRTTEPIDRSPSSELRRSSSSATITLFMKLCGGLSNRTVSTLPTWSVSSVRAMASPSLVAAWGGQRLGDAIRNPPMNLDVAAAIDCYLDDRRVELGGVRELREFVHEDVGEAMELCDLPGLDAERRAEDRLEFVALDLLGLGQELEDAAAIVVEHHDSDRRARLPQGSEAVHVVVEAEITGDDPRRSPGGCGRADARRDEAVDAVGAAIAQEPGGYRQRGQERLLVPNRHRRPGVDEIAVPEERRQRHLDSGLRRGRLLRQCVDDRRGGRVVGRAPTIRP